MLAVSIRSMYDEVRKRLMMGEDLSEISPWEGGGGGELINRREQKLAL
jgi:hypothetical protein